MKTFSIGRDLGCDVVVNDTTDVVSRRHAVLNVGNTGKMTLTDLSSNGTYINGIKMAPNVAVPVSRKDSISFAHVATLDWDMIPKPKTWRTWLIIGLCLAAIAAIALWATTRPNPFGPRDKTRPTDTIALPDSTAVVDSIAADTLDRPVADTLKEQPAEKKHGKAKKQEQPEPQPETPTDTVKPQPRPIGV